MDKLKIYRKALYLIEARMWDGVCTCLMSVSSNDEEFKAIKADFRSRLPSIRKPRTWRFYFSRVYTPGKPYKWRCDEKGRQQRILFLKHVIKELESHQ
jgi:hypothetical protein